LRLEKDLREYVEKVPDNKWNTFKDGLELYENFLTEELLLLSSKKEIIRCKRKEFPDGWKGFNREASSD
jgi:hypothetical protein